MEWQIFPTETRRFKHTTGFLLKYNLKTKKWSAMFWKEHTEMRPSSKYGKEYMLTEKQKNRLIAVGNKMRHNVYAAGTIVYVGYMKPEPYCEFSTCKQIASVPTYKHNHGRPYYCVDHRGAN